MTNRYIPPYLKTRRIWILWRIDERDGRKTKIPISAAPGLPWARSNHPEDWTDYDTAAKCAAKTGLRMGVMLPPDRSILFVDVDDCIGENGELSETAKEVLEIFPSCYCEKSVSGHGLHLLACGTIPRSIKNSALGVELYNDKRFAALTLDAIREADVVPEPRTGDLFKKYATKRRQPQAAARPNLGPPSADDEDIIREIEANEKYSRLWAGQWKNRFNSRSEADLSMMNFLAYLTDKNPVQMARIFERSGLVREKWYNRPDYRERTIGAAIEGCQESRSERRQRIRESREAWLNDGQARNL